MSETRPTVLNANGITKSFVTPAGRLEVLKSIDLQVSAGDLIAVTGASGAGKSTLLHILGTIDRPTSGTLSYDGREVLCLDDTALSRFRNRHIGFVFQFHHLMPEFTALENTLMPGLIAGDDQGMLAERAGHLLSRLGIYQRRDHRPGELSGGEQQRVAVARALLLNPRVLLADEPTGNLDRAAGEELFSLMKELNTELGITVIMVTHNEGLARQSGRTIHLADGLITDRN